MSRNPEARFKNSAKPLERWQKLDSFERAQRETRREETEQARQKDIREKGIREWDYVKIVGIVDGVPVTRVGELVILSRVGGEPVQVAITNTKFHLRSINSIDKVPKPKTPPGR